MKVLSWQFALWLCLCPAILFPTNFDEKKTEELRELVNQNELIFEMERKSKSFKTSFAKKIMQLIEQEDADPNVLPLANQRVYTPYHWAGRLGNNDLADFLLAHGADINLTFGPCATPLMLAVHHAKTETVKKFLQSGADINAVMGNGDSALIIAVKESAHAKGAKKKAHERCAIALLKSGVNVDTANESGKTAVSIAAAKGLQRMTLVLLEYGANLANPTSEMANGEPAPTFSELFSDDIKANLLEKLNSKELKNGKHYSNGLTRLEIASITRNEEAVVQLLLRGAKLRGKISFIKLAKHVKEWQIPRSNSVRTKTFFQQICSIIMLDLHLCAREMPVEIVESIIESMPWG